MIILTSWFYLIYYQIIVSCNIKIRCQFLFLVSLIKLFRVTHVHKWMLSKKKGNKIKTLYLKENIVFIIQ